MRLMLAVIYLTSVTASPLSKYQLFRRGSCVGKYTARCPPYDPGQGWSTTAAQRQEQAAQDTEPRSPRSPAATVFAPSTTFIIPRPDDEAPWPRITRGVVPSPMSSRSNSPVTDRATSVSNQSRNSKAESIAPGGPSSKPPSRSSSPERTIDNVTISHRPPPSPFAPPRAPTDTVTINHRPPPSPFAPSRAQTHESLVPTGQSQRPRDAIPTGVRRVVESTVRDVLNRQRSNQARRGNR